MSYWLGPTAFTILSILWCGVSASGETLRCQSVNGNFNCASSSGASCQTVDSKTVCVRNHGDVMQSFGKGTSPGSTDDGASAEKTLENTLAEPVIKQRLEQRDAADHRLLLERDGTKLHAGTDRLSIDRK